MAKKGKVSNRAMPLQKAPDQMKVKDNNTSSSSNKGKDGDTKKSK